MVTKRSAALVLVACCLLGSTRDVDAGTVFWGLTADPDPNLIQCADRDGSNVTTLFTLGVPEPRNIFFAGDKLYFSSSRGGATDNSIRRINLDGSGVETLVTVGTALSTNLTGSLAGGKMYWRQIEDVYRANLDGTSVEMIATVSGIKGLAVSSSGTDLYWIIGDAGNTIIRRADPDGTNATDVLVVTGESPFLAGLAVGGGRLYWSNFSDELRHATVTGTDLGVLPVTASTVFDIYVDESLQEIYLLQLASPVSIWRSNLDGSAETQIVTGNTINSIAVLERGDVPAVATWGLVVMAMLLLVTGTVISLRRALHPRAVLHTMLEPGSLGSARPQGPE